MYQPGLSPLWSSHYYGNVSAGPAICRPRWQVLQFNWLLAKDSSNNSGVLLSGTQGQTHCPTMKRTSNINVFKLNHRKCYLKNFLSALSQGFKKLPQTSHQHGEVRPGESSPPLLSHSLCVRVRVCVLADVFMPFVVLCAGWSSARVAGFWWRDGLWLWQGVQVLQRQIFLSKNTLTQTVNKVGKDNYREGPFASVNYLFCSCHILLSLKSCSSCLRHLGVPEDHTYWDYVRNISFSLTRRYSWPTAFFLPSLLPPYHIVTKLHITYKYIRG